jgi:membrane-bound metal-dependent hydrolase YbcI (DUF457 family)
MIWAFMASPIGHALAGIAVAWGADLVRPAKGRPATGRPAEAGHYVQTNRDVQTNRGVRANRDAQANRVEHRSQLASWYQSIGGGLTLACAILAAAPDLDLLFIRFHRTATHSVTSFAFVALISAVVAARLRKPVVRVAITCSLAWSSHMLLDWLSADQSTPRGFQLLWPFDATWFISGWDWFPGTERRRLFSGPTIVRNATTAAYELLWMTPIVVTLWALRRRRT